MQLYTLKILEITAETKDTSTIVFKQPALKKIKYQAGQYLTLIFRINGRRYLRPYSFSSCPFIDKNLEITVKRVPSGVVSNHILDQLKVGDAIEAIEPLGKFILDENHVAANKPIIFWGAGSGITPLISLLKSALFKNLDSDVTLVYGNRNTEGIIFADKIKAMQKNHSQFKAWHFFTQHKVAESNPYIVQGRISSKTVLKVMSKHTDVKNTLHYICGPTGLKESVKEGLKSLAIPDDNIYYEDFEIVRNEADFKDIITRNITITKDNIETVVEVIKGKSILEAGLDASIELSYSCQTGDCNICKGRLTAGQIKTIVVNRDTSTLNIDEFLLCCSFPLTENIKVIVD